MMLRGDDDVCCCYYDDDGGLSDPNVSPRSDLGLVSHRWRTYCDCGWLTGDGNYYCYCDAISSDRRGTTTSSIGLEMARSSDDLQTTLTETSQSSGDLQTSLAGPQTS